MAVSCMSSQGHAGILLAYASVCLPTQLVLSDELLHDATVGSMDRLDGTHNPFATAACLPLHTCLAHCQ